MFDYATASRRRRGTLAPTVISAMAHAVVLAVLAIAAVSAAEDLPSPPDMMAFVVSSAPPPPPPPPAAPPPRKAAAPRKVTPRAVPRPPLRTAPPRPAPAAPVEAPAGIAPETGLEVEVPEIEAGFEGGVSGGLAGGVPGGAGPDLGPPPAPPPPPPAPVRVGGDVRAPRLVHRVNPNYPGVAMQARIEGVVILEAVVDRHGRVDTLKVLRGHPLLNDAASAALREWRYEPLRLNGQPTPFVLTVTISFTIG